MKQLLFIGLLLFASALNAQTTAEKKVTWDYPVKPGTAEWRESSYDEKIKKSQPSKELLNSWDTETLWGYCLNYPFNKVTLLFNNPNDGFKRVYDQSVVWQEFILRKDAIAVFTKYLELRPYKRLFEINNIEDRNNELFIMFFLDKIVSETNFTVNLNLQEKKKLANVILQNHQSKKNYPEEFTGFHYNSSLSAMLRIMENDAVLENKISQLKFREETDREYFIDNNMDVEIITKAFKYINQ
jgi:carbonic anhydrase